MIVPPRGFIMLSGGFDPLHVGHLRMIRAAAEYGPVVVALNSDAWLIRKKGFAFMPWGERAEILCAMRDVDSVTDIDDQDGTACEAISRLSGKILYFGNGGDRTDQNTPELTLCRELGIEPIFGLGGGKVASSSDLVARAKAAA